MDVNAISYWTLRRSYWAFCLHADAMGLPLRTVLIPSEAETAMR